MATPTSASPKTAGARASLEGTQFMESYPDLLTVGHLHELTGLSEQTIRAEINVGKLPGCRIGRRIFVPKQSFLAFIEKGITND